MTQVQTEQLITTTFDGRKLVLVTLTGVVLSGGVQEILLGDLEEVVYVFGPTTPVTALISGLAIEYGSAKSTNNPKNGVVVKAQIQQLAASTTATSGTWTFATTISGSWTAATTAQIANATIEFLALGN